MRRAIFLTLLAILLGSPRVFPCQITGFSPASAPPGATLTLTGSGFTGATSVIFTLQEFGLSKASSFAVLSDTQMTVSVPAFGPRLGGCYITVITGTGLTVTLEPAAAIVGNGVSLVLSGGGATVYVEAGGVVTNNGDGDVTVYVKSGGVLQGSGGGGGNVAYAEPGATVTLPGAGTVSVPQITQSPVSALFQILTPGPAVTTGAAINVDFADATLNGTVNPEDATTTAYFQYGTNLSYGNETPSQSMLTSDSAEPVAAALSGLAPNTVYHYRLVGTDSGGTKYGADMTFTTATLAGGYPGLVNVPESGVSYDAATLNAIVDPNGSATTAFFQYGLSGTYGSTTTTQALGNGTADVAVQASLGTLLPGTTYHFRVVATNAVGTVYGNDQAFQTGFVGISSFSPAQSPPGATVTLNGVGFTGATSVVFNLPTAGSQAVSFVVLSDTQITTTVPDFGLRTGACYITVITNTGVTVTLDPTAAIVENGGLAGPLGGAAVVYVEWGGVATNDGSGDDTIYVKSGGFLNGSGGGGEDVTYEEPGATVTVPGAGAVPVPQISQSPVPALFQVLPPGPAVTTGSATNVEFIDATANGTINPEGTTVTAYFQYGTDSSYGSQSPSQSFFGPPLAIPISASLTNLTPGTLYHFRLVATDSGGTNYGADQTFTTASLAAGSPGVLNTPLSGVSYDAATFNAIVDPNGVATSVWFQYGISTAYGFTTPAQALGSGTADIAVQASIGNLLPDTTYHYRIVVTTSKGTTYGADQLLQTGAVGISGFSPAQAPAGAALTLSGVGFTGATGVMFQQIGNLTAADFVVVSDTEMKVTVPDCGIRGGGYYITMITNAGVTVTLDPAATIVGNGSSVDLGGSAIAYVEGGGAAFNNGSGDDTIYLESGGLLEGSGGGGENVAYAEPGATVSLPGAGLVSVPQVSQSPVSALFQFLAPCLAVTGTAVNVEFSQATANGIVNPENTATTAYIQYGPASSSGSDSPALTSAAPTAAGVTYQSQSPSVSVGSGSSAIPLTVNLSSLTSDTLYHFRVVATNGAGTTYGLDQEFTTAPSPYQIWDSGMFTAAQLLKPAISGATATPAGDGTPNLLKYALGMKPMMNSTTGLPILGTASVSGSKCLTLTYAKVVSATDITYHPEWSTNLSTWSNTRLTEVIMSNNGVIEQVRDSIPLSSAPRIFFHLRVTMP